MSTRIFCRRVGVVTGKMIKEYSDEQENEKWVKY